MILKEIQLYQFRCYQELRLNVDEHFNVIHGLNGQGKTSLLEAISLLSTFKSFRMAKNAELLKYETAEGRVFGNTSHDDLSHSLEVRIWPNRKQALLNGKSCRFLSEYVGKLNSVSFSPMDLEIIQGGPDNRRVWADKVAQVFHVNQINLTTEYQKILDQRNRLLKRYRETGISKSTDELDVWTEKLCDVGAEITLNRVISLQEIAPEIEKNYERISGLKTSVNIEYFRKDLENQSGQNALKQGTFYALDKGIAESKVEIKKELFKALESELTKDLILGSTSVGPHRDELKFYLNGHEAKSYASQGETRSLLLGMRLAEVESMKNKYGYDPLLLIDDFSSELDAKRRAFLLNYLIESKSQIFLTTTENLNIGKVYRINQGKVFWNDDATAVERF